jgi:poly-gamma-glutamate system protein
MLKYRAKSNIVLGAVALLCILALVLVENTKERVKQKWYDEKMQAAELSQQAALCIKSHLLEGGAIIEDVNDPNETALVGQEFTHITTDRGYLDAKLSSLNPNIAAIVVQYLKDAGVRKNDRVAITLTGSFPALNISVLSAVEVLGLKPIIITSVGSSNYGANDPNFTWLDMENVLFEAKILHTKSVAASLGGGFDEGRGLSPEGRSLIIQAIKRNKIMLINEGQLEKNIDRRMKIYDSLNYGKPYKVFINIGGGIASLGHTINANLIPSGLSYKLPDANFPVRGVMILMGEKGTPIIQFSNIREILKKHNLPYNPIPLPEPGNGGIYTSLKYNLIITYIVTSILVVIILLIYFSERKIHQLGTETVPYIEKENTRSNSSADIGEL